MDGRDKPDHDTRDNLGDGRKPQPLTCTLTVWAAPEVAPLRSATNTSKLAACVLVPSCVNDTLPLARSACVKRVMGVRAPASVMNPLRAFEMVKVRFCAVSSGSSAVRSCWVMRTDLPRL